MLVSDPDKTLIFDDLREAMRAFNSILSGAEDLDTVAVCNKDTMKGYLKTMALCAEFYLRDVEDFTAKGIRKHTKIHYSVSIPEGDIEK